MNWELNPAARVDEFVAERNTMTAHIGQLARDWQTSRDETAMALRMHDVQLARADRLEAQLTEIRKACASTVKEETS